VSTAPAVLRSKLFWVGILYFAEGLPFGIFYDVLPVYFRELGVGLRDIGFLSLLGLAWTVKFLWAPAVDYYRHHRRWMLAVDLGMSGLLLLIALHAGFGPPVWIAIAAFAFLSATNDIAIDGYTVELLDKNELGLANGVRLGMYRVGILTAGVILIAAAYITWLGAYALAAALMAATGLVCLLAPPERAVSVARQRFFLGRLVLAALALIASIAAIRYGLARILGPFFVERESLANGLAILLSVVLLALAAVLFLRNKKDKHAHEKVTSAPLFAALSEMLERRYIVPVIGFILTYKLGDVALGPMVKPFWVDAGFSTQEIGLVSVNIGLGLSIAGGLAGGWFIDRAGVFRALWVLGLAQAAANLGYVWAASVLLPVAGDDIVITQRLVIYTASAIESFALGLGSAAFLAFLMAIVNKKYSAAEYAVLSSLFALTRHLAGFASGFGAYYMGYASYFMLTFFLHFPAYVFLPSVRKMIDAETAETK
jgi:MFS transporter, PAT family, beta-lactamase induction signal transducer AmpG